MSPNSERFHPPKEWNAIGTGIGTLIPTIPTCTRAANSRAASPSRVKIAAVYDPIADNRKTYDRRFGEFMEFYKRAKPIYRRMNPVADSD